ncbi:MAG: hypothetical protein Q9M17_02210 [Mariprofundus sp.]|nr:hypothetical protein [Mariprofundus sp.]
MKRKPATEDKPSESAFRIISSDHQSGMFITNHENTATIKSNVDLTTIISPVMDDDATINKDNT